MILTKGHNILHTWRKTIYIVSNPMGGFKGLNPEKINLVNHDKKSLRGCVLEADSEYPKELHELLNHYALAPGRLNFLKNVA